MSAEKIDALGWLADFEGGRFVSHPKTASEHMDNILFQSQSAEGFYQLLRRSKNLEQYASAFTAVECKLNCLEESLREFREFREAALKEKCGRACIDDR